MMLKAALPLPLLLVLAACGGSTATVARPAGIVPLPTRITNTAGLERVLGHSARELTGLFGQPDVDLVEGQARKMQFGSRICVLDAYLYPPKSGRGEATVTHLDTRQRDGSAIDRASCVAALTRREGGK